VAGENLSAKPALEKMLREVEQGVTPKWIDLLKRRERLW
jgi:hypothetical protein